MTIAAPSTAFVMIQSAFTDAERLALAGFLAGYRGLTREAYALDLRQFTTWCRASSLNLFAVRRADIERFARELEARGRARATASRRLCTIAGFCKIRCRRRAPRAFPGRPACGGRGSLCSPSRRAAFAHGWSLTAVNRVPAGYSYQRGPLLGSCHAVREGSAVLIGGTTMFTRTVTFTGATDIEAGTRYLRDTVVPLLREQAGFRGVVASADRSGGVLGVLSLWDTAADRDASESTLVKAREEGQRVIGGQLSVEQFEELLLEVDTPPAPGRCLLLRRISMDPARIDENLGVFTQQVLPQIKAQPGFCAIRTMMNRQTGQGMVGTIWADQASMDAAAEAGEARRERAAQQGVTFGEQTKREIVLVDLR
jgi:heme-degrading monooxygenase HmoA